MTLTPARRRMAANVAARISELLMRSSKEDYIDSGDAIELLGDALDTINALTAKGAK